MAVLSFRNTKYFNHARLIETAQLYQLDDINAPLSRLNFRHKGLVAFESLTRI